MRQIFHLLGILFHLMSRDGGKLIDFHPKVESFHLFRLQCRAANAILEKVGGRALESRRCNFKAYP